MNRHFTVIGMALLLWACGGEEDGTGAGSPAPAGNPLEVTVAERTDLEQHTLPRAGVEGGEGDPYDLPQRGVLARGDCGKTGIAFRRPSVEDPARQWAIAYAEIGASLGAAEAAKELSSMPSYDFGLVYDDQCAPMILYLSGGSYAVLQKGTGGWTESTADAAGAGAHHSVFRGADGKAHAFATSGSGASISLVHGTLATGTWSFAAMTPPTASDELRRIFQFAVSADGAVHVVFNEDRELWYGSFDGSKWSTEKIFARDNFDAEPAWNASIALNAAGAPAVASTFFQRAVTGSFKHGSLHYLERDGGTWSNSTVANRSDGYEGGDGDQYTGDYPWLVFDGSDRPVIAFCDIANWHGPNGNDTQRGQVRVARREGKAWRLGKVLSQKGQTESPNPLHDAIPPAMVLDGDGAAHFLTAERQIAGDTLRFDTSAKVASKPVYLRVSLR
jgi:hypothetical protein